MLKEYTIGIDDTDSHSGMCTTYLATLMVNFLERKEVDFLDFPWLVRLNPNIPYKTRGNGAVSISFITREDKIKEIWRECIKLVEKYADIDAINTDPGIVLQSGKSDPRLRQIYKEALYSVIKIETAKEILRKDFNGEYFHIKEGRGLIGASAAIGADLQSDYTFEFIAYRDPNIKVAKRLINEQSVILADKAVPLSFGNYDYIHNQLMITPHGPDPVYVGIRGETAGSVIDMWSKIEILEKIKAVMIFRSNQHTQPHFPKEFKGEGIKPYHSVRVIGRVEDDPFLINGGHVLFSLISDGKSINCAAYEPTKIFRHFVRELTTGDELMVYGGVRPASDRYPITINLEHFEVLKLKKILSRIPVKCPQCNGALKSLGTNQGFRCKGCKYIINEKEFGYQYKKRGLRTGVRYTIPICAQRHLTKPLSRDENLQFHKTSKKSFKTEFKEFLGSRKNLIERSKL
jgi:tRNA(Ile2)-agmatinylcytidine synthase